MAAIALAMSRSVTRLLCFAHAVREGSFSLAAARMGVTQSAVSQQVAKLETALGAPLLLREREGLRLTPMGRETFEIADRLLTVSLEFDEKQQDLERLEGGHLTVIANAPRPALSLIGRFSARHPGVSIEFGLMDWTSSMSTIRERGCDIAIVTEPKGLDAHVLNEIERVRYVAYLRPDHPLAARKVLTFDDLRHVSVLLPEKGAFTRRVVSEKLAQHGKQFGKVINMTTFPLIQEAVLHGVGVGIFLDDSAHESTRIVTRPILEMPETYGTYLVCARDKAHLRLVQAFRDCAHDPNAPPLAS